MNKMIEVIEKKKINTLEVKAELKMYHMPKFMRNVFPRIFEFMKAGGKEPTEAPYARYYNIDWKDVTTQSKLQMFLDVLRKKWRFSAGWPLKGRLEGKGNIVKGELPAGKFIKTIHKGPYRSVGESYKEMVNYAAKNKLIMEPESIEFYTNDPRKVDKKDIETIILIPVKEKTAPVLRRHSK
ncbi:GyrI-like domain-containing protein [Bacteroidota bacterium]